MSTNIQREHAQVSANGGGKALKTPSYLIELAYLGLLLYTMVVGPASGLLIPLVGAGTLAGLALLCLMHFGSYSVEAFRPIKFALGCAISVLLLQGLVFQESLLAGGFMRSFLTWALGLIVIQSLSLRKGFLHRFALVAFLIGCGTLPFMKVYVATEDMMRVGGDGMPLGNPNFFGMWFGFCAIYFLVAGLEAKNYMSRTVFWLAGILCLYLVAITVSRGPLLGVAIAMVLASEKVLKRSFLPILGFLCFVWAIYVSGIFDDVIGYYVHRGAEESGRSRLWSWALEGIFDSWGLGVGMSNAFFVVNESTGEIAGPHNSVLLIWLSSGFLPLICYIAYLIQAARGGLRARRQQTFDSPYMLPLVSFAMLELMVLDGAFMSAWHMVVFSMAIGTVKIQRHRKKTVFNQAPIGSLPGRRYPKGFA